MIKYLHRNKIKYLNVTITFFQIFYVEITMKTDKEKLPGYPTNMPVYIGRPLLLAQISFTILTYETSTAMINNP